MNSALHGLRVIESSAFIAAPFAGLTLAQMGAEVIRVDPIGGGLDFRRWPLAPSGASLYWAGLNKSKRSVCIDLRRAEGRELLAALIAAPGEQAGLFLTNLPTTGPLDHASLCARRPDLITVAILGRRDGGVAIDYTVNASTGFPLVTGPAEHDGPVNHVLPAWDLLTGQSAALALVAAERHRRLTGAGQRVQIALEDVALSTVGHLGYLAQPTVDGALRPRRGNEVFAFGRDFATRDGGRAMIAAVTTKQWRALGAVTGLAPAFAARASELGLDFDDEEGRFRGRAAIYAELEPWVSARSLTEIEAAFAGSGVCWGPYRSFHELAAELRRPPGNPLFSIIEQPGIGSHPAPGSAIEFGASPRQAPRPAPALGADTAPVLAALLGLSDRQIGDLHDRGIAAGPTE